MIMKTDSIRVCIDIDCYFEVPVYVEGAEKIDEVDEDLFFHDLLTNIELKLDKYDFKIVDAHQSNRSRDSYYYTFYVVDKNKELRTDYLICFRISMHNTQYTDDEAYYEHGKGYYREMSEKYKMGDERPEALFKNIVIGKKPFVDDYAALQYIDGVFKKMSEPEADLPYILKYFKNGKEV